MICEECEKRVAEYAVILAMGEGSFYCSISGYLCKECLFVLTAKGFRVYFMRELKEDEKSDV